MVEFNLDYWMYAVIEEVLQEKLSKISKKYNKKDYDIFKDNRFDELGKVKLSLDKIKMIHENHSFYLQRLVDAGDVYGQDGR